MSTRPATSHPESAIRLCAAPALVLATVESAVADMAEAFRFHQARTAEAARVSSWGAL